MTTSRARVIASHPWSSGPAKTARISKPNPDEVASIHSASFAELVRPGAPQFDRIPESDREVLSMKLKVDQIFAPTAAMLYQFREVAILGQATRVIDYDQPRFAWR